MRQLAKVALISSLDTFGGKAKNISEIGSLRGRAEETTAILEVFA